MILCKRHRESLWKVGVMHSREQRKHSNTTSICSVSSIDTDQQEVSPQRGSTHWHHGCNSSCRALAEDAQLIAEAHKQSMPERAEKASRSTALRRQCAVLQKA